MWPHEERAAQINLLTTITQLSWRSGSFSESLTLRRSRAC